MEKNLSTLLLLSLSFFTLSLESIEPMSCEPVPSCRHDPCCTKRPELQPSCTYNASARQDMDSCSEMGFYFKPTFIFWQAKQDNLELGASLTSEATDFFLVAFNTETTAKNLRSPSSYKPGFQLLLGTHFDFDQWDLYGEYTWFLSKNSSSINIGNDRLTTDVGITPTRGNPYLLHEISLIETFPAGGSAAVFNRAKQEWTLKFQSFDLAISRAYYTGQKLTVRSSLGARFAWMTQKNSLTYFSDGILTQSFGLVGTYEMDQNFALWGAGILAKMEGDWMLGKGCSLISRASGDLLYARVQASNTQFSWIDGRNTPPAIFAFPEKRPDFLLPHMNFEFGFGWETFLDCYRWHLELEATYSFQVFWHANLFRNFTSSQAAISQAPSGNLNVQGLNVAARCDF